MTFGKTGVIAVACIAGVVGAGTMLVRAAQQVREVSVTGSEFSYSPARIEVQRNDVVKITFTAGDMAHSFTIDNYRIAKRAGHGQAVTFEFRADQPGEHTFYCNLSHDDRCRNMKGTLVVR